MIQSIIEQDVRLLISRLDYSFLSGKQILLTGASGLVGTYLLAALQAAASKVKFGLLAINNSNSFLINITNVPRFSTLSLDLELFREYEKIPNADIIIHAAGYAQPQRFIANPVGCLRINTACTAALLDKLNPFGTFVFLSSAAVYAGGRNPPFTEDMVGGTTPYHPRSSYIEGKRCGEAICYAHRNSGIRAISIRLGDTYGPGTHRNDKRSFNNFIDAAINTGQIELRDSGDAVRNYLYICDAVETILRIISSAKGHLYNLGDDQPVKIRDVARKIAILCEVPLLFPDHEEGIPGSAETLDMDITKIVAEFGKIKRTELDEGLGKTILWRKSLWKL